MADNKGDIAKHENDDFQRDYTSPSGYKDSNEEIYGRTEMAENHAKEQLGEDGTFQKIIQNGILVLLGVLGFCAITLIPFHNVIVDPEYWYEAIMHLILWYTLDIYFMVYLCRVVMNYPEIESPRAIFNILLTIYILTAIFYVSEYIIWTLYFGFYQPFPLHLAIQALYIFWIMGFALYFQFPAHLRKDRNFRSRIIYFILFWAWNMAFPFHPFLAQASMPFLGGHTWIVAFEFILIKELNKFVMEKLVLKAAGANSTDAIRISTILLNAQYTFAVATLISSSVDQFTSLLILGTDFVVNLYMTYNIVRLHINQISSRQGTIAGGGEKTQQIFILVLTEAIEFLVPILFIFTFTIAYLGPNYDKIGNVGLDYWLFVKIPDLVDYLTAAFYMACLDALSIMISIPLLWTLCRINLFHSAIECARNYGKMIVLFHVLILNLVSKFKVSRLHWRNIPNSPYVSKYIYLTVL